MARKDLQIKEILEILHNGGITYGMATDMIIDLFEPITIVDITERERNKRLYLLLHKLTQDDDIDSIVLLKTMVDNDTLAMKKSFEIMTKNTQLKDLIKFK